MSLHTEVIVSILAAGLLGLGCGWMISRVRGERRLRGTVSAWEARHDKLERESGADVERLESRLETLGAEMRALVARDREAEDRLARSEAGAHKAQSDIIGLNRQQAETQERLQQIIRRKNREIASLQGRSPGERASAGRHADAVPSGQRSRTPARPSVPMTVRAPVPRPSAVPPVAPSSIAPARAVRARPVPLTPPGETDGSPRRADAGPPPAAAPDRAAPANAANASGALAPFDDSLDATELVDAADVTHVIDVDDTIDDTVVATHPARPTRPAPTADVAADETLDSTGESTVVLDETQIRDARAAHRRGR